jgi:hypothetical protein
VVAPSYYVCLPQGSYIYVRVLLLLFDVDMVVSRLFVLLLLAGLGTHCTSQPAPIPTPSPTFNEASRAVLQEVTPLVAGRWTLDRVQVRKQPYELYPATFPADTVLQQFATLTLGPASYSTPSIPRFEGTLIYKGVSYPVYLDLQANPAYVLRQEGLPTYLLFGYRGPIASHTTTADEQLLQEIGLMDEYFSLAVVKGQPTMTWQGQKRHIKQIDFHK